MGVGKGGAAGKAEAMMRAMGWKEGEALGRNAERPIVSAEEMLVGARLSKNTAGLRAAGEAAAAGVGGGEERAAAGRTEGRDGAPRGRQQWATAFSRFG
jgi:hypothetical protein